MEVQNKTVIDIRSDTVTPPTQRMREAMSTARVGDDVFGEDPTMNELEKLTAEMFGKQAALFTPSGVMSNSLSVMCWTVPGNEIICWSHSHIVQEELAGITQFSGVQTRMIDNDTGILSVSEVEPLIRKEKSILYPQTALICIQNTVNGKVWPLQALQAIQNIAKKYKIPVHMDGARVFNAAVASRCEVREIAKYVDSVSFCLSKGLCCPVGSMLVGPKSFIEKARKNRKCLGGGMRQVGIFAAAGLVALRQMIEPLTEDHRIARYIGQKLSSLDYIKVNTEMLDSNMVFFVPQTPANGNQVDAPEAVAGMLKLGIKINEPFEPFFNYRIVVHHYIRQPEADRIIEAIKLIFGPKNNSP